MLMIFAAEISKDACRHTTQCRCIKFKESNIASHMEMDCLDASESYTIP